MAIGQQIKDPCSNKSFKSITKLCEYYHINPNAYYKRRDKGYTPYECIFGRKTKHPKAKSCIDPNGKSFDSIKDMCTHWGTSTGAFDWYKTQGCTLEECLTKHKDDSIVDDKGRWFPNQQELCKYHNLNPDTFRHKKKTMSIADIIREGKQPDFILDPFDNQFKTYKDMCEYYNVSYDAYMSRRLRNWSMLEALNFIPHITGTTHGWQFTNHFTIIKNIKSSNDILYFLCMCNNHEIIMSYKSITAYCTEQLRSQYYVPYPLQA